MNKENKESQKNKALYDFLVGLGDDAVVLGHRLSEWCSNGPYLEEDIALSNIALDYIGRARMFYQYAAELHGDQTEDDIAYLRDERKFTNLLIYELPINDFAFTMIRQFFVDVFYCEYLAKLTQSNDERIAAIATKSLKESEYHLKRSQSWVTQLLQGTDESRQRCQDALIELENFIGEFFVMPISEKDLAEKGVAVDREQLKNIWDSYVQKILAESDLDFADSELQIRGGREGVHTEHLGHMLSEMQYLQRTYPGLDW